MTSTSASSPVNLQVQVASGEPLSVRRFTVDEQISSLFSINLVIVGRNENIEFDSIVGQRASFTMLHRLGEHSWSGIASQLQQVRVLEGAEGLSTYHLTIVPELWLATQRKNYRIFQQMSEPDIVKKLLAEWGIAFELRLSSTYKKRKYRVQYGETDFAFLSRMLEDAGISYYFRDAGGASTLVLHDAPQSGEPRAPLAFRDRPTEADREHVTRVRIGQRVRPGKVTLRDHDYRLPAGYKLAKSATQASVAIEERLEEYQYAPGAFLFGTDKGDDTPAADDRGKTRTDEMEGQAIARKRLEAKRASAKLCTFETSAHDLSPGAVVSFLDHPRVDLAPGQSWLIVASRLSGTHDDAWEHSCEARSAAASFRPPLVTPRPKVIGVESALVVGPAGEEIHTDEFGRVRVHFHWDRESRMDEGSSCWIHVSQPWSGAGFGGTNLPRVGQEVLVDFLGGDPDRPVIVGRLYTNLQKTPYRLPDKKTQSGWQSRSSPGGGADNYNEIMFEDRKGNELLRMQAEKDLQKLVKHDENVTIQHDLTGLVGNDEQQTVAHDRTRAVGHDEVVSVGHDRTRLVRNNESVTIGENRSKVVGVNESLFVGVDQFEEIGANRSVQVGANHSEQVGANRSEQVGANHSEEIGANMSVSVGGSLSETVAMAKSETVALASAETVGVSKALTVGAAYAITVGGAHTVTVGGAMETSVALAQTEIVGLTKTVAVGEMITISCGASTITMDKTGKIVVTGKDIEVNALGTVNVNAKGAVNVGSASTVNVKGSNVAMN